MYKDTVCPYCGATVVHKEGGKTGWIVMIAAIALIIILRFAVLGAFVGGVYTVSSKAETAPTANYIIQKLSTPTSAPTLIPTHEPTPIPPYCDAQDVEETFRYFDTLRNSFLDAGDAASKASGIELVNTIASLARIKQQLDDYHVPECLKFAKADLSFGIGDTISGFDAFRQSENPDDAVPYFQDAETWFEKFNSECEKVAELFRER